MAARHWPQVVAAFACITLTFAPPAVLEPQSNAAAFNAAPRPQLTVSALPPAGTYPAEQLVTLRSSAPGTIYYTTDGSDPSPDSDSHVRHVYQRRSRFPSDHLEIRRRRRRPHVEGR